MQTPPLILLIGPTAVGKTELSLRLAERVNGEIISADSRLFYRGMDIGTAKPSRAERARVPHHLIDVAAPDETVSLAEFQRMAKEAIADIHARGRLPFLVGGTGQYIRAVTEGWTPPEAAENLKMRSELETMKNEKGAEWLHAKLKILDEEAAAKMDWRNARRTIRALEVIFTTGRKFSAQSRQVESPYRVIALALRRPRAELYQRVDERIEAMFQSGLLEETSGLLSSGYTPSLPSMSAIGYRECAQVLRGEMTEEQAKIEMRRMTRVFVRRQANWFKESDPKIQWFYAGSPSLLEEVQTHLLSRMAGFNL